MPSTSKKQHNFMNAIAHNKAFAKKVGVPQSVGKDFAEADKGKKFKQGGFMKHSDLGQDKKMVKKAVAMHDKQLHGGKKTNLATLKKGGSAMCGVKKMAVGGNTGSFNSTGSNPYLPAMQTGAIGGLDQLNQSLGTIKNALGGSPPNVGESNQMYKKGGKVKKMADGGMPVDPRAAAMAAKRMPMGAKRGAPIADPRAMAAATQRGVRGLPAMGGTPQGKPMVGRMPPQANMPVPTMKKGGGIEIKGKTKGKMVKMARGGGIEVRGKTR